MVSLLEDTHIDESLDDLTTNLNRFCLHYMSFKSMKQNLLFIHTQFKYLPFTFSFIYCDLDIMKKLRVVGST